MKTLSADLQTQFDELVAEWAKGTVYFSLKHQAVAHPAYRALLDLGPTIIPMIVEKLRASPGRLFYLLNDLTGENPVPPESAGKVAEIAACWVRWYESRAVSR